MKFAYWLQPIYMVDNSFNPQLSCLLNDSETMDSYIEQSKMQLLVTWATEIPHNLESTAAP